MTPIGYLKYSMPNTTFNTGYIYNGATTPINSDYDSIGSNLNGTSKKKGSLTDWLGEKFAQDNIAIEDLINNIRSMQIPPESDDYSGSSDFSGIDYSNLDSDATFKQALKITLGVEGGYSNAKNDHGGATQNGITHITYDAWRKAQGLPTQDVRKITKEEVIAIAQEYWVSSGAAKISKTNPNLAIKVFDAGFNMGPGVAQSLYKQSGGDLKKFTELRIARYYQIVAKDPTQREFLSSWLGRC